MDQKSRCSAGAADVTHRSISDMGDPNERVANGDESLTPEEAQRMERRYLLRRYWKSALQFWRRGGPRRAWLLTGGLLVIVLLNLGIQYGINLWNRMFFDALEKK